MASTQTQQRQPSSSSAAAVERVWALSDVHTDAPENMAFIERLDAREYQSDALILAGDVTHILPLLRKTLRCLRQKFAHVFFVPGNHDLWLLQKDDPFTDSLQKLVELRRICKEEAVETLPRRLPIASSVATAEGDPQSARSLWIVPLLSWHCKAFDTEPEIDPRWEGIPEPEEICTDYELCRWPGALDRQGGVDVAQRLDDLNDELLAAATEAPEERPEGELAELKELFAGRRGADVDAVVSFSHFLPRIELIPEKRYLYFPSLTKIAGSPMLGERVARLRPDAHIFGHTHFGWDQVLDDIRYLSPPVGMPRERDRRLPTIAVGDFPKARIHEAPAKPLLVWEARSGFPPKYEASWPRFYEAYGRHPEEVTVLPEYSAKLYRWNESQHGPKAQVTGMPGRTSPHLFGPAWALPTTASRA